MIEIRMMDPPLAGLDDELAEELMREAVPLVDRACEITAEEQRKQLRKSTETRPGEPPVARREELLRSITTDKARRNGRDKVVGYAGSRGLEQAGALEFGFTDEKGRVHHPHPWMRPADAAAQEPINAMLRQEVEGAP